MLQRAEIIIGMISGNSHVLSSVSFVKSLMVWGTIGFNVPASLIFLYGKQNSEVYQETLQQHLITFGNFKGDLKGDFSNAMQNNRFYKIKVL